MSPGLVGDWLVPYLCDFIPQRNGSRAILPALQPDIQDVSGSIHVPVPVSTVISLFNIDSA